MPTKWFTYVFNIHIYHYPEDVNDIIHTHNPLPHVCVCNNFDMREKDRHRFEYILSTENPEEREEEGEGKKTRSRM